MITLLAVAILCIVWSPVLWEALKGRRINFLDPSTLFALYVTAGYVLPISEFREGTDPFTLKWFRTSGEEGGLIQALALAALGSLSFVAAQAACAAWRRRRSAPPTAAPAVYRWDRKKFVVAAGLYTAVGLALFEIGVLALGGWVTLLAGLGDRIRLFAGLNYFVNAINLLLVVCLVWWVKISAAGEVRKGWFWIYTIAAVGMSSLQGSKSILFVFVLAMLVIYQMNCRRLGFMRISLVAMTLLVCAWIYEVVAREFLVAGEFVTVGGSRAGMGAGDIWQAFTSQVMSNFIQLQMLVVLVENVPALVPWQWGATFASLATLPIPSAIWPEKPLSSTGILALHLWPDLWNNSGTTIPPGFLGECYLNLGWIGVVLGMGGFGAFYGLGKIWALDVGTPFSRLVYGLQCGLMLHYIRGEWVAPTSMLLIFAVPALFACAYCRFSRTTPEAVGSGAAAAPSRPL